jgi:MFS family permease
LAVNAVLAIVCAVAIINPARPTAVREGAVAAATANPYRSSSFLVRIHAVSVLLVVPQFTLSIFGIVWLVSEMHWNATGAGILIGVAQFIGAIGRIGMGVLSDRVGSRVRVLRWVAVAGCVAMLAVAVTGLVGWGPVAAVAYIVATTISVADNGLAFTSVAEAAGTRWSGKALGMQNTGQFLAASAVGPLVGALIALIGYPLTFAAIAVAPALSIPLIPIEDSAEPSGA